MKRTVDITAEKCQMKNTREYKAQAVSRQLIQDIIVNEPQKPPLIWVFFMSYKPFVSYLKLKHILGYRRLLMHGISKESLPFLVLTGLNVCSSPVKEY